MTKLLSSKKNQPMTRQENSIWLGRAMSTSAVTLQAVLKLIPIVAFLQHAIQALYERYQADGEASLPEPLQQLEAGVSAEILTRLKEIESQLEPLVKVIDEACARLQKEI